MSREEMHEMLKNLPSWLKSATGFSMAANAQPGPTREDMYLVNVQIEHPTSGTMINYGTWDKMSGGDVDSNDTSYRPGGMAPPISLGGSRTVSNVTVSRLYRLARDHAVAKTWQAGAGRVRMIVTKQPLDVEGNIYGDPIVYSGKLKTVKLPTVDSEANAAAIVELEMTVEGYPA